MERRGLALCGRLLSASIMRSPLPAPAAILLLFVLALAIGCGEGHDQAPASAGEILAAKTLGLLYLEEHRLEEAGAEFARLVRMAPEETAGHANLGLVYLRLGRYGDAERAVTDAASLAPQDAEIRLLEATVYQLTDRPERARRILNLALDIDPAHVRVLYALAEADTAGRVGHLSRLVDLAPSNVAARLALAEALLADGALTRARDQVERLDQQLGELPPEAADVFAALVEHSRANRVADAREAMARVKRVLATTPAYQEGMGDLLGPAGAPPGYPVLSFSQQVAFEQPDPHAVVNAIRFTDVTTSAGLDSGPSETAGGAAAPFTQIAAGDADSDGDPDVFVTMWRAGDTSATAYLLRNDAGTFTDVAAGSGIGAAGRTVASAFADYDNDGHVDLYLVNTGPDALYRNNGDGTFHDVSRTARIADPAGAGATALFADLDQSGSLDIFLSTAAGDRVYRGTFGGTFREQAAAMGLAGAGTRHATYGDFDESGRIDLVVARDDGLAYYRGTGSGRFEDVTLSSGLDPAAAPRVVAAGDYDQDGSLDLVVLDSTGAVFHRNRGNGTFERDGRARAAVQALAGLEPLDAAFLDFDNDGLLDLVAVGRPTGGVGRGVVLLHNSGGGRFTDRSPLLPHDLGATRQVVAFDFDADGGLDLLLAGLDGRVRLLRNDGASANQFVVIRLAALSTGSGPNNHFGIGARLEVRAGDSYQTRTVTGPSTHFGLGNRLKVDVLRIVWPDGVPQTLYYPGTDDDVLAEQALTGWGRPVPIFR